MIVSILVNSLWQGALIVALAELILRFVAVRNATTRYAVWFVTALALTAVPMLATLLHWHLPIAGVIAQRLGVAHPAFSLVPLGPLNERTSNVAAILGAFWIAGTTVAFLRLALSSARIASIRRRAQEIARADSVPVLATLDLSVPIAAGIFSPAILIPRGVVETSQPAELECTI